MPHIDISDKLWNQINAQREFYGFPTLEDFLGFSLDVAITRYCPAVGAIVTRNDNQVLMVGNDYGGDELIWNLPGGAVDPGEDLIQTLRRELKEETGITALKIGPLAWVIQVNDRNHRPFVVGFAFEIAKWEGEISLENEIDHGDVQQARFMSFDEAMACMLLGNRQAFRDWLADRQGGLRIYFSGPEGVRRVR